MSKRLCRLGYTFRLIFSNRGNIVIVLLFLEWVIMMALSLDKYFIDKQHVN